MGADLGWRKRVAVTTPDVSGGATRALLLGFRAARAADRARPSRAHP